MEIADMRVIKWEGDWNDERERERERERAQHIIHVANMSWAKSLRRVELSTLLKRTRPDYLCWYNFLGKKMKLWFFFFFFEKALC